VKCDGILTLTFRDFFLVAGGNFDFVSFKSFVCVGTLIFLTFEAKKTHPHLPLIIFISNLHMFYSLYDGAFLIVLNLHETAPDARHIAKIK